MIHFPIRALVSESQRALLFAGGSVVVGFERCGEEVVKDRWREGWRRVRGVVGEKRRMSGSRTFIFKGWRKGSDQVVKQLLVEKVIEWRKLGSWAGWLGWVQISGRGGRLLETPTGNEL
jgi:hypothetical protein